MQVAEASRAPTQAIGFHLIQRVPARSRPEAADSVPTLFPVDFGCAPDAKCRSLLERFHAVDDIADHASANAKLGITFELIETLLEIVGLESQVAIQLDDELPISASHHGVPVIEGIHDPAPGFPETSILAVYGPDPRIAAGIIVDDLPGVVLRAIINDDPFRRADRLGGYALDRRSQMRFLVANRSDDYIAWVVRVHVCFVSLTGSRK